MFDADTLPAAIAELFRMNNYTVEGPVHIHGAEIDLVATPTGDPFASKVYIEATIEHVDNDKYGKDVGKLALVGEKDPSARRLIVSSRGFSLPVRERARESRIDTLTYEELFRKFERFEPYLRAMLDDGPVATELAQLDAIYEEPVFVDAHGQDGATEWLGEWYRSSGAEHPWLITVGEYGTGKTALTRVVQRRWLMAHRMDPSLPVPFRIELRDFTRQFDADGLLHHFLDRNSLGHIPLEFVWSLIRSGRVVLLLDGYDEMAQYLSARERRVCLEALAHLSSGGARGLLTSRPNYFSEAEEFQLFDVLYRDLEARSPLARSSVLAIAEQEAELDSFIETQFIKRYERALRDLDPNQTEELVRRVLGKDARGAQVVIDILRRVFRTTELGAERSLSGKPVIISYLLEVVEQLKGLEQAEQDAATLALTEWGIYALVVDQLMLRDYGQAGQVMPGRRRRFLHVLALHLSQKDQAVIGEEQFRDLISREFRTELRRYDGHQRQVEVENLFEDLRRSGTLARSVDPTRPGWRFSHNSLREFLLAEGVLEALEKGLTPSTSIPVTDAMRIFVRSQAVARLESQAEQLARLWGGRQSDRGVGRLLSLLWDGLVTLGPSTLDPARRVMALLSPDVVALDGISLSRLSLSSVEAPASLSGVNFQSSELEDVLLAGSDVSGGNFRDCILENVDFSDANLAGASFINSLLVDVNLSRSTVAGSDFRGIDDESSILVEATEGEQSLIRHEGAAAIGYLSFMGAKTDPVDSFSVLRHHPDFPIVAKVCAKFSEHSPRQRLGVEQKGAAMRNVPFARRFVAHLEQCRFVEVQGGRTDVLYVTPLGRSAVTEVASGQGMPPEIESFLRRELQ
ncbi:UNVERIFIED_ORG: NACHT domain-containing protein [Bacillus sp. AZ43]